MLENSGSILPFTEIALRLVAAIVLGGALGLDRELKQKPAGIRTNALVALGAAAIVVMSLEFPVSGRSYNANALTRVIQGILTGIGFLGAGVIMRVDRQQKVHGLTTAASIWIVACLGIACGAGRWRVALLSFGMALAILVFGERLEHNIHRWFGISAAQRYKSGTSEE